MKDRASEPDEIEAAIQSVQEALGWLAAGLTVWIDRTNDPFQPKREVVISMLRQGESGADALAGIARRMRLERDGAEYDTGCMRADLESCENDLTEARRLHDEHCVPEDHPTTAGPDCVPPWRKP